MQLKEQGNASFRINDFKGAIKFFSQSLELIPENPKVLNNRAIAYKNLGKFQLMYDDSIVMIEVDSDNYKGYLRNAEACIELVKGNGHKDMDLYEKGLKRFQKAISLIEHAPEFKDPEKLKTMIG